MAQIFGSPGRYVQQRDLIGDIGEYVDDIGTNALFVASPTAKKITEPRIASSLDERDIALATEEFTRESTAAEIDRLGKRAQEVDAEFIIGAGGGKTLDTVKAVGEEQNIPSVIVPTIASTDAPCSALSVVYTEEGEFEEYRYLSAHPRAVLVDTTVIAEAPTDLFIAGIGDAMATWFEAEAVRNADGDNVLGGKDTLAGPRLAQLCYETIREHSRSAVDAVDANAVTESVEHVVEANTLLSGVGFESGGIAAAHSVHNGLVQVEATHGALHGEKVNIGTLTQLVLEGRDDEFIREIAEFSLDIGLPVTLADIGLDDPTDEQLTTIAEAACAEGETIHEHTFDVSPEMVRDALLTADQLGRRVSQTHSDTAPVESGPLRASSPAAE